VEAIFEKKVLPLIWPFGKGPPMQQPKTSRAARLSVAMPLLVWVAVAAATLMGTPAWINGAGKPLHLGVPPHGWPPYIIVQNDQISGIALDIVKKIGAQRGIEMKIRYYPEKRAHRMVEIGEIDAWFDAKEWTANPQRYLWTDPMVESEDRLICRKASPVVFNQVEDLFGKTIGTHLGYYYPRLETHFEQGRIVRSDTRGEAAMLKMLLLGRTDAAIVNQLVALWVTKRDSHMHQADFSFSKEVIDCAGYRVMFTRENEWAAFIDFFNTDLAAMKRDGRLDRIIFQYR
jgi:polar amino acid transport system substrate-binding protein